VKKVLSTLIVLLILMSCGQQQKQMPIVQWDGTALQEDVLLVDVRTPAEYQKGHLDGAVNIDFLAPGFADQWKGIDTDRTIYVYCKVGGRSAKAAKLLDSLGYQSVVDLTGGYDAWQAAKSP
jgi:rhodanese-related sulfurtransferase